MNLPIKFNDTIMSGLETMTSDKIAKINERMVEMDRANQTAGKKNSQTTSQMMSLTMLTDSPYRRLRQILTQIEQKRSAVEEAYFSHLKKQVEVKEWKEEGSELSLIKIAEAEHSHKRTQIYIEGALKEIAMYQEAYEEIRTNNNIPVLWDEEDFELEEIRHHMRQAFRQAHRDMIHQGTISQGNAEYLEQYGVHLHTAQNVIGKYIAECQRLIDEEGKVPNITHLYEFLDNCVEIFGDEYKNVMKHIGLDNLVRQEFLYRSTK
jgi:hypothetical protein